MAMAIRDVFYAALLFVCFLSHLASVELISADLLDLDYGLCNPAKVQSGPFVDNLNVLHFQLGLLSSQYLFRNVSVITNSTESSTDNAYGFYQCRTDLSLANCSTCVSAGVEYSVACGSSVGVRLLFHGCFLRRENYNFIDAPDYALVYSQCLVNSSTATASFRANLASVLNATAQAAPANGGFNSTSRGGDDDTAYALAQCWAYLSPSQCTTCLQVSDYRTLCPDAVVGATFFSTCYYRYSNSSFNLSLSSTAPTPGPGPPPLAPPIEPVGNAAQSKTKAVVGAVVGAILFLALFGLLCFWIRRHRKKESQGVDIKADGISKLQDIPLYNVTKFSLNELRKATNNFHTANKLGEGGFGPVFKGTLLNGRKAAIKVLSIKSHQGTTQFLNEVRSITTVQHRNLVEFLGYCVDDSKRILVYEYLPNRSLDVHLFDYGVTVGAEELLFLDWHTRCDIVIGVAKGLQYLHEESHIKIVHRDIKTSNILLDNNLSPKIADFGLARLFDENVTHYTTNVAGTMGYLAPEYAVGGQLTEKVDVYGFGLVALEILSGRRLIDARLEPERQYLLDWTWTLYEMRQQLQLLDPNLVGQPIDPGVVIRMVHVALLCTQTSWRARPTMSKVVAVLCGESDILELPTKPLLVDTNASPLNLVSESLGASLVSNQVL